MVAMANAADQDGWVGPRFLASWINEGDLIKCLALLGILVLFTVWNRMTKPKPKKVRACRKQHAFPPTR